MNDDFMMDDTAGTDEFDGVEDTSLTPESGSDSLDGVSVQEADAGQARNAATVND